MKRRRFNWIVSDVIRKVLKRYLEWSARLKGQRFYCRALGGESEYNLTINCDLTVSCNCQDYDGSGHLGDLNKNSFQEVFFGPVARRFREELAKGKLPIMTCARCGDLQRVPKSQSRAVTGLPGEGAKQETTPRTTPPASAAERDLDRQIFAGPKPRLPYRGMLLENTVRCNIDCIGCDRQSAARIRTTQQMDLEKLSRMADLVHELGLEQLFYLNLGEPFLSPNIGQELPLLRQKNPDCRIVISTNGIVLNTDAKREAALNASHIYLLHRRRERPDAQEIRALRQLREGLRQHEGAGGLSQRPGAGRAAARMEIPAVQLERPPADHRAGDRTRQGGGGGRHLILADA